MKKILLASSLLLFSTFAVHSVHGRPSRDRQDDESARGEALVPLGDMRRIKLGMTREHVLTSMRGKPDDTLAAAVWIYWNFQGNRRPATMERPALLIFFTGDRVTDIRYSEENLVRTTLAQLRRQPPAQPALGMR